MAESRCQHSPAPELHNGDWRSSFQKWCYDPNKDRNNQRDSADAEEAAGEARVGNDDDGGGGGVEAQDEDEGVTEVFITDRTTAAAAGMNDQSTGVSSTYATIRDNDDGPDEEDEIIAVAADEEEADDQVSPPPSAPPMEKTTSASASRLMELIDSAPAAATSAASGTSVASAVMPIVFRRFSSTTSDPSRGLTGALTRTSAEIRRNDYVKMRPTSMAAATSRPLSGVAAVETTMAVRNSSSISIIDDADGDEEAIDVAPVTVHNQMDFADQDGQYEEVGATAAAAAAVVVSETSL